MTLHLVEVTAWKTGGLSPADSFSLSSIGRQRACTCTRSSLSLLRDLPRLLVRIVVVSSQKSNAWLLQLRGLQKIEENVLCWKFWWVGDEISLSSFKHHRRRCTNHNNNNSNIIIKKYNWYHFIIIIAQVILLFVVAKKIEEGIISVVAYIQRTEEEIVCCPLLFLCFKMHAQALYGPRRKAVEKP